jgi:hypothetical protein
VHIRFDGGNQSAGFEGHVTRITFGRAQYVWRAHGASSHPDPNAQPATDTLHGGANAAYTIPAQSITVVRGASGAQ